MILISAILELVGILLVGLPILRLAQAHLRISRITSVLRGRQPRLVLKLTEIEKDELVWPSRLDLVLVSLGLATTTIGLTVKVIYYSLS